MVYRAGSPSEYFRTYEFRDVAWHESVESGEGEATAKLEYTPEFMEMFLVVIQLGAILAVVLLFWNKLWPFVTPKNKEHVMFAPGETKGFSGFMNKYVKWDTMEMWFKVIVGALPAAVIGLPLDDVLEEHFYNFQTVSITLIVYGVLFIIMENRNKNRKPLIKDFSFKASSGTHVAIVGPTGCGKTTLLRDIARNISNRGYCVGIADERCEIAAMHNGESGFNLGYRTAVLDNCLKSDAMEMLLRSMSPDVILTDELGTKEDAKAAFDVLNSGVSVIASAHGRDIKQIMNRTAVRDIMPLFDIIIILSKRNGAGTIESVIRNGEYD